MSLETGRKDISSSRKDVTVRMVFFQISTLKTALPSNSLEHCRHTHMLWSLSYMGHDGCFGEFDQEQAFPPEEKIHAPGSCELWATDMVHVGRHSEI